MTHNMETRTYHRGECIVFLKTHEAFGGLSNMAGGYPLSVNGVRILTSEALYQACRFPHMPEIQRIIIGQHSPMAAKMKSKPYRKDSRPDWDAVCVSVMRWCLRVKLAQNWDRFGELLQATGSLPIVEESRKDQFWGAKPVDENLLIGRNVLGRLLMELREQLLGPERELLTIVEPPRLANFLLLGHEVGPISAQPSPHPLLPLASSDAFEPIQQLTLAAAADAIPAQREATPAEPVTVVARIQEAPVDASPSYRKKLIEVALPLEDINRESAREKSIRHGHPSTLHLWWARRPLAACRAVLFAQMVDDPSSLPDEFPTEAEQEAERERLFDIIRDFVKWENTTKEEYLHPARVEIARSAARNHGVALPRKLTPAEVADALKRYAPPVLDPFAGGGSIPLEAQRLGLEAHASDLNPVAVLINKALIEIPPKFAGRPPVNPESRERYLQKEWKGAQGLAEDVRYYGKWMRDEAFKRIGHLYPKVRLPKEQGGGEATVIAWIWARTVTCPNPACAARMPLVRSFALSTKKGKEARVELLVNRQTTPPTISFTVRQGKGTPEGTVNRNGARCKACDEPVPFDHVRAEGKAGHIGAQMMAIVAESKGGRVYLPPSEEQVAVTAKAEPLDVPDTDLPQQALGFRIQGYGMTTHRDLFTPRQLVALTTYSDLVSEARDRVLAGSGSDAAYADAVATYLALGVSRLVDICNAFCRWENTKTQVRNLFSRQAISMLWDYAEPNVFAMAAGDFGVSLGTLSKVIDEIPATMQGDAKQLDATAGINGVIHPLISTDPPYYDNVPYADLSDVFYVWLRRALNSIYPDIFGTLLVPKTQELVAEPSRHGGTEGAKRFFEQGLEKAFVRMRSAENPNYPVAVFYAFKQAELDDDEYSDGHESAVSASTGWETMLVGLLSAGFAVSGTWPTRTELGNRMRSQDSNALASSIVLVCRPRPADARPATRKDFLNALKRELPAALKELQRGNIAPVDLAQAAIGPGMAVFSRYSKVIEADGSAMRVRTALQLINQALDEVLAEQEGEFDADTRFAVAWFEQYGMGQGKFGVADVLARAKNTSVGGLDEAGILEARGGNVRLLRRDELPDPWNPHHDHRLSVWKVTQQLIRAVMEGGGAQTAAALLDAVGSEYGDKARDLAYRLYVTSERKKWTQDAFAFNTLVTEWHDIAGGVEVVRARALERDRATVRQGTLIEE